MLEACRCEFEGLPSDLLRSGASYGVGKAKEFVREKTGVDIPTSKKELVRLGTSEAKRLADEELRKLGVPNIPINLDLITNPTPEKVKDAAYAVGKPYVEKAIQAETGIPIKLPRKLTIKELERTVGGIFPTNVAEVLNTALTVGTQLAASALTSVLAGTAIGSAIPGLGTIVGLAVGLAVAGIKSLFSKAPTHSEGKECKFGTPRMKGGYCKPPDNLDAFQLFAWSTKELKPVWDGLRKEQRREGCGRGKVINCARTLNHMRDVSFWMSLNTVSSLGLPEVATVLSKLSSLPEIDGGLNFVTGYRGTQPLSDGVLHRNQSLSTPKELAELLRRYRGGSSTITRGTMRLPGETSGSLGYRPLDFGDYVSTKLMVQALRWRKAQLEQLLQTARSYKSAPAHGNVAGVNFELMGEFATAAVQIQNNPSPDAISWFKTLWGFVKVLSDKQEEATKNDAAETARRAKIATRTPADEAALKTARAGCNIGHQPSCAKLKELQAKTPTEVARQVLKSPGKAPPHVVAAAKREVERAARVEPIPGQPGVFNVRAFRRKAEEALRKARAEMQRAAPPTDLVASALNVQPRVVFPSGSLSASLVPCVRGL